MPDYIVGEGGPHVFTPTTSGRILTFDRCVCNHLIATEPYYGLELSEEQDDRMVYLDPGHPFCLSEWGVALDPFSPLGISHLHYAPEEAEDDIRPS